MSSAGRRGSMLNRQQFRLRAAQQGLRQPGSGRIEAKIVLTPFRSRVARCTIYSDRIAPDHDPPGGALEAGDRFLLNQSMEEPRFDNIEVTVAVHDTDHHEKVFFPYSWPAAPKGESPATARCSRFAASGSAHCPVINSGSVGQAPAAQAGMSGFGRRGDGWRPAIWSPGRVSE